MAIYVGDIELAQRHPDGQNPLDRPLTAYESRYLADNRRAPPARLSISVERHPITDLHTHLAGCLRADDLLRLGAKHGVFYEKSVLAEALIHGDQGEAIAAMQARTRATLARALSIPIDRQVTFSEMEKIYRLRTPITKAPELFVDLLRQVAQDYAAMGVL